MTEDKEEPALQRGGIPGTGNSRGKGPGAGKSLGCSGNRKKADVGEGSRQGGAHTGEDREMDHKGHGVTLVVARGWWEKRRRGEELEVTA